MPFDPKCYELAAYFLRDCGAATDAHRDELAQVIQDAIEDWPLPREEYPDNGPTDPWWARGRNRILARVENLTGAAPELDWINSRTAILGESFGMACRSIQDLIDDGSMIVVHEGPAR